MREFPGEIFRLHIRIHIRLRKRIHPPLVLS